MVIRFTHLDREYWTDLSKGVDISIPLIDRAVGPKCFYAPDFRVEAVRAGDFVGSTQEGSPVNFKNIFVNPHGNGTHTECAGHITSKPFTINQCLRIFHFVAALITVEPKIMPNLDHVITHDILNELGDFAGIQALVIRTLPNGGDKLTRDYSGSNPAYFNEDAIQFLNDKNIKHLLTDLPSIDREEDGGKLAGHKAFWGYPDFTGWEKTITEMVYVPSAIQDGLYLCNIQIASIESDASPSKVVLYPMKAE